ncbi:MAG: DMT family transporter [Anaerolinea sp.]|nr:DMT family transporter [Anaerolinea sp.]
MEIILGLTAALGWGGGDFLAGQLSRRLGSFRTLFFAQIIGILALGVYIAVTGEYVTLTRVPAEAIIVAFVAALLNMLGAYCLYRAFEIGLMAVVSPICASYGALTAILAFFSGERLPAIRVIGVAAAVIGVLLTASLLTLFNPDVLHQRSLRRGIGWALAGALLYGVVFWVFGFAVTPYLGGILPVFLNRSTTFVVLFVVSLLTGASLAVPRKHEIAPVLTIGVLDTIAYVALLSGSVAGAVSIVTVLSSLYTTVTVVLAAFLLHERLHPSQWIGVGLILSGIVLVGM